MKSFIKNGIGKVVTDYGTRVMDILSKGRLGQSVFTFFGIVRTDAVQFPEKSAPATPSANRGGVVYVKSDGKIYYKSSEVAEVNLSDHDDLVNFVAEEHYRWDNDIQSTATINHVNLSSDTGTDGEVLVINENGDAVWGAGERIVFQVRNDEGVTIPAGAPLYSRGEIGTDNRIRVGVCNANDPAKMPCIGIAMEEMNTSSTKDNLAIIAGIYNKNISGFTGLAENDILYVQDDGSLSQTKPTGESSQIQNVGVVIKTNGTMLQGLKVSAIGRTNDVPNLNSGNIFMGNGSNQAVSTGRQSALNSLTAASSASAEQVLIRSSSGDAVFGALDVSNDNAVTGTLPVAHGGTGLTSISTLLNSNTTATDVGLGNVTNESKATMFTSPTFTGSANAANLGVTGTLTAADVDITGVSNALTVNCDDGNVGIYVISEDDIATIRFEDISTNDVIIAGADGDDFFIRTDDGGFKIKTQENATTALEVTAAGELKTHNIGNIFDTEAYLTPVDFTISDNTSYPVHSRTNGGDSEVNNSATSAFATFQVPLGYEATHVAVYGSSTSSTFDVYSCAVTTGAASSLTSSPSVGSNQSLSTAQSGVAGKYLTIKYSPGATGRKVYGAKITLART